MEVGKNEGKDRGWEGLGRRASGTDQSAQSSKMVSNSLVVVGLCLVLCGTADSANNVNVIGSSNITSEEISDVMSELREAGLDVTRDDTGLTVTARMKMSDFMFNPLMFVPSFIAWGFAPILLANLKLFVFQALMINQMALSSAIYMTLRNIVFGPRPGNFVKYANYGYGGNKFHHHHRRRTGAPVRM